MLRRVIPALLVAGLAACVAAAQSVPADKAPTTTAKADEGAAGKVTVESVTGPAQKLVAAGGAGPAKAKWEPLKAGDILAENAVIRTGLRAKVVLRFEDRAVVTLDTATKMGIGEFRKVGRKAKVRLGLKYGRMGTAFETDKGPNDVKVTTPVATLSVRGCGGYMGFTGDWGLWFMSLQDAWGAQNNSGGTRNVNPGEMTGGWYGLLQSFHIFRQMFRMRMGDWFGINTEAQNLIRNGSGPGIVGFGGFGNIFRRIIRSMPPSSSSGSSPNGQDRNGYNGY